LLRVTPLPLLVDLLRILGVIRRRRPRLLKSGYPGKRDLQSFNKVLTQPLDAKTFRSLQDSGYILFLYELGYQLDLFEEKQGQLRLNEEHCFDFFSSSYLQQQRVLQETFPGMVLWNELHEVPALVKLPDDEDTSLIDPWRTSSVLKARQLLTEALPSLLETPKTTEECTDWLLEHLSPQINIAPQDDSDVYPRLAFQENKKSRTPARFPEDQARLEGQFWEVLLTQSLHWMGWIESDMQGAWVLTQDFLVPRSNEEETTYPQTPSLLVQANLECLLFPSPHTMTHIYQIEKFCKPLDGDQLLRYRFDKDTFSNALQQGLSYQQCVDFLSEQSRIPIPENVLQVLKSWYNQCNQIVISKKGAILEASNKEELDQWTKEVLQGLPSVRLDDTHLFIPSHAHKQLRKKLQKRHVQNIDYDQPPSRFINVNSQLRIDVEVLKQDIFAQEFLSKIAKIVTLTPQRATYQITKETLTQAIEDGKHVEEILEFFETRAHIFPSTARLRLESLTRHIGNVYAGQAELFLTEDEESMDRLLYEGGLSVHLKRIGPAAALIVTNKRKEFESLLESFGLPNQDHPNPSNNALWEPEDT